MTTATGQEWRVTEFDGVYFMTPPGADDPWLTCFPKRNFEVTITATTLTLEEWYHLLPARMTTLVETARISEQVGGKDRRLRLVDDGDHSDTTCTGCSRPPTAYQPWGATCEREGCAGRYVPAHKDPAR